MRILGMLAITLLLAACGGSIGGSSQQADPALVDTAIAYVKRSIPIESNNNVDTLIEQDVRTPSLFNPGAALYLRNRASITSAEKNLTDSEFAGQGNGLYDVKDLTTSWDGKKLLFAMRAPEIPNADEDEQPTWNIWEYDSETDNLRRVIASDIIAEAGHDIAPHYLRDGRIVFSSTRQRESKAILLDEGKPQFSGLDEDRRDEAFVLHVMDDDGENIQQITFNQSHDLNPAVLVDGRILFSRWDNASGGADAIHLYTVFPDGTGLSYLYGKNSHDTGSDASSNVHFIKALPLPDGDLVARVQVFNGLRWGSNYYRIDAENFSDHDRPLDVNVSGTTQTALFANVSTDDTNSSAGRYAALYPLNDDTGRLLVSWSQCLMWILSTTDLQRFQAGMTLEDTYDYQQCTDELATNPLAVEATPRYGIWMYDPVDQSLKPVITAEENTIYSELVALEEKTLPDATQTAPIDIDLAAETLGIISIRSVYDLDGVYDLNGVNVATPDIATLADPLLTAPAERSARFIRIVKAVSRPDDDLVDFGNIPFNRNAPMREILGYAPIEPDGSVKIAVPANVAFSFDVLNGNGQRMGNRHSNWLQLRPGEERQCNGCHDQSSPLAHGRIGAEPASVYAGASDGVPFANTDTNLVPNGGETMAETWWRLQLAARAQDRVTAIPGLSVNLLFTERWGLDSSSDVAIDYNDYIDPANADNPIIAPTTDNCLDNWSLLCRVVINYETHIRPLWNKQRLVLDAMDNVLADNTCTTCHGVRESDETTLKVADAQLNLSDDSVDRSSYEELLSADVEQEVLNGALQDRAVEVIDPATGQPACTTDPDSGEELRDPDTDDCIDVQTQTVPVRAPMSGNGAMASSRFFTPFFNGPGSSDTVDHRDFLSDGELKLLSEWLDIGAQYYNNPFDVPVN